MPSAGLEDTIVSPVDPLVSYCSFSFLNFAWPGISDRWWQQHLIQMLSLDSRDKLGHE